MAENESILTNPPTPDAAIHVRDYVRFTKLLTIGAAICFVIGLLVLAIL
jgi:HD superfamily phosphodiesterase